MNDIPALIARIEALEAPDRDVDFDIAVALDIKLQTFGGKSIGIIVSRFQILTSLQKRHSLDAWGIPRFTANTDAALSLVPDAQLRLWWRSPVCSVDFQNSEGHYVWRASHKLLACAIVLTALRMKVKKENG